MSTALLVMWMWMHGQVGGCPGGGSECFGMTHVVRDSDGCNYSGLSNGIPVTTLAYCEPLQPFVFTEQKVIAPDPLDVPAVQETKQFNICGDMSELDWRHYEQRPIRNVATSFSCVVVATYDTCFDKSRVLLTSEDGKRHCIKFGVP